MVFTTGGCPKSSSHLYININNISNFAQVKVFMGSLLIIFLEVVVNIDLAVEKCVCISSIKCTNTFMTRWPSG